MPGVRVLCGALLLLSLLGPGCLDPPAPEGLRCSLGEPCPAPLVCSLEQRCVRASFPSPDAGPAPGVCLPPGADLVRGWALSLHPLAANGEPDEGECLASTYLDGLPLDYDLATSTRAAGRPVVLVARGRRSLPGATVFRLDAVGGVRLRAGGFSVYDASGGMGGEGIMLPKYLHGQQSVVLALFAPAGGGRVRLSWASACETLPAPGPGEWRARYYRDLGAPAFPLDNTDCLGAELIASDDLYQIWNEGAPTPLRALGVSELFGAVYTAERVFAQPTQVDVYHDDGLRIRLNGSLFYESWNGAQGIRRTLDFPAGSLQLEVEYFDNRGQAGVHLLW